MLGVLLAVIVIASVAAGAYALNRDDDAAKAATPANHGNALARSALPTIADKGTVVRALDHAHPLRLWIGGDSLAGSFGPSLGDQLAATGIVQTQIDYKVSSGLWSNDVRDWYARAQQQMAGDDPEAVVFIIGTNDTPTVNNVDANGDKIPDWEVPYRAKVDKMMEQFVGPQHRTVLWLGPPTLGTKFMDDAAQKLGTVMREEAAKYAPDVVYVDTYKLFEGPDGGYSRRILDDHGNEFTARIGDDVHFSEQGAKYLAGALYTLLDSHWHLTKQADVAQPIAWTLASGSGENVPGYNSASHSRYRSRSTTRHTTRQTYSTATTPATSPESVAPTPTTGSPPTSAVTKTTDPPATTPTT